VRIAFIATYEIWFRGFFLFICIDRLGNFNAVALNVVLYVLLHAVNGKREMLSCIPFGILLCAMAIWFESPLPAVLIHLALTVPYDIQFVRIKSKTR
jgi:membrane protease YdiL (CAAX protease family)